MPKIPEHYRKVAHRFDQYTQVEVTIWYGRDEETSRGTFFIETNDKLAGPYTKLELESTIDCIKMDLDFKNPASFV
jgi:hypothetical protein